MKPRRNVARIWCSQFLEVNRHTQPTQLVLVGVVLDVVPVGRVVVVVVLLLVLLVLLLLLGVVLVVVVVVLFVLMIVALVFVRLAVF